MSSALLHMADCRLKYNVDVVNIYIFHLYTPIEQSL